MKRLIVLVPLEFGNHRIILKALERKVTKTHSFLFHLIHSSLYLIYIGISKAISLYICSFIQYPQKKYIIIINKTIRIMSLKLWSIRSESRKFGLSFTVPDRVSLEISDKKRVKGKHPLRICRIPFGDGPLEFHNLVMEAQKYSNPFSFKKTKMVKNHNKMVKNHNKSYHRSRFNDWYVEVSYSSDTSSESQISQTDDSSSD